MLKISQVLLHWLDACQHHQMGRRGLCFAEGRTPIAEAIKMNRWEYLSRYEVAKREKSVLYYQYIRIFNAKEGTQISATSQAKLR